jgi:hypothetical protein
MVARPTPPLRHISQDQGSSAQDLDPDSAGTPYEPVRPAEAPRQQALALVPSPRTLAMIGGGIASAFVGAAIGYWLGKRRARRPARPIRNVATTVHSVMELVPVAMHLLANPLVRALALRMILRQLKQRIDY